MKLVSQLMSWLVAAAYGLVWSGAIVAGARLHAQLLAHSLAPDASHEQLARAASVRVANFAHFLTAAAVALDVARRASS